MASTQDHLPVEDIKGDMFILKDGSIGIILKTSAVNFGLLSENEQLAIISGFASFLNSLSFAIQIVVRSERLDISSYLEYLSQARGKQTNPLLANMLTRYKEFVSKTVRENKVLDKQFFICLQVSHLELGITKNTEKDLKKAQTVIIPRRDHIIRQLWRMGLKAKQLSSEELVRLIYEAYNPPGTTVVVKPAVAPQPARPASLPIYPASPITPKAKPSPISPTSPPVSAPVRPQIARDQALQRPVAPVRSSLVAPFVVEELTDDYGRP